MSISQETYYNGKYKKISELGRGASGFVDLCVDNSTRSQKKVAIKFLLGKDMYYNKEQQIMEKLDNPFVVSFFGSFYEHVNFCIVMEYLENGDLDKKIKQKIISNSKFDINSIYLWTRQMVEGIVYLHLNKIIHRDLKPSNLFLTKYDHIKLGDFGIAREKDDTYSTVDTQAGTFPYMSPEVRGNKRYSFNTDIWSIGCVVFELITLRRYFNQNDNDDGVFYSSLEEIAQVSNEINELIRQMLDLEWSSRIGSEKLNEEIKNMACFNSQEIEKKMQHSIKDHELSKDPVSDAPTILRGHIGGVSSLAVLKNNMLASGSHDKTIRVWDSISGNSKQMLSGHTGQIYALVVLSDNELASASEDSTIRIWNISNGEMIRTLTGHTSFVYALAKINTLEHMAQQRSPYPHLVSGSYDKSICIWNITTGENIKTLEGHNESVSSLADLKNCYLASGSYDKTIHIWDTVAGRSVKLLSNLRQEAVEALAALPKSMLASSSGKKIHIWDINTGNIIQTLDGHTNDVWYFAVLSKNLLASCSSDNTLKVWNIDKGDLIKTLTGHTDWVLSVAVLSENILASCSNDMTIRFWDI